ncbi:aldehyde dehydrogenase domain-containing protein [Lipomyces oligophaga]|uniref:aldehyde dehydrogenase domain-containing protein n=1 Tax=Lipomyces oligophaga TaxID=45792 RepID=UPI0034CE9035
MIRNCNILLRRAVNRSTLISRRYLSSEAILDRIKQDGLLCESSIIDGEEVYGSNTFAVQDPATGGVIGTSPDLSVDSLDQAIGSSLAAFKTFKRVPGSERSDMLTRWRNLILEYADDLAGLITFENGKPFNEAKGEVMYAASFLSWFAGEATRIYGDMIQPMSNSTVRTITMLQPIGVVGVITPWNFPAAMITRKVAAAIAAGCTAVVKPDSETPFTALALGQLALRAGIPPGVLNIVTTKSSLAEMGKMLCEDPRVRKISFTGSTAVGGLLMKQSSSGLKKLSLELGGNAPFIVFEDADIDQAVSAAIACKFRGSGQTCVCANRIYVAAQVYDEFVDKLTQAVRTFVVGNGFADGVTHGPLIHERAIAKVERHVQDAVALGGRVLVGGSRATGHASELFFQPTVIRDATNKMLITHEETFGPVAGIFKFSSEQDAIDAANDSTVGLASYVMTKDLSRAFRVAEQLDFGMVGLNTGLISDAAVPFGGVKQSGFGREGSKYGIHEYLTVKAVSVGGVVY